MATTSKVLFRGPATLTTSTTLYTVPASTTAVVTNIAAVNTTGADITFTLSLGGIAIQNATIVPANATAYIDMKQVLIESEAIQGGASASGLNFHISGVEIG